MEFECREAAIAWICANQLGRRNITEETRKFLEQTNKVLADKGIAPVMLSDKMKEKIGIPVEEEKHEQ